MPGLSLLHRIDRKRTDRVNGQLVQFLVSH
jgi:hypothetical protein